MQNFEEFKRDLSKLISIDSEKTTAEKEAPFGGGVKTALDEFLNIARKMNFECINYDGYGGEIIFGKGEEIGIIGHLDVVPAGTGWTVPPFSLTEKDGYFYGRGIMDDKAPMLLCLYALKELADAKLPTNKKFRLIVGCNEESGWKDLEYIKTKTTLPEYGFSPDGNFPVSYAEKGMSEVVFSLPKLKNFYGFTGGSAVNAVCGYAEITPKIKVDESKLKEYGLKLKDGKIISKGKSAHGSCPQKGKNALLPLLKFLKDSGEDVENIIDCLFNDIYGLTEKENEQGKITFSPDVIKETEKEITLICDLRVPAPFTFKTATEIIDKFGLKYKLKIHHPPLLVEKDGEFIQTLLGAYKSVTNKRGKAISQGGSTFARAFKKGCAFGPEFPNEPSTIHGPDERVKRESLLSLYEIYKKVIFDLSQKK